MAGEEVRNVDRECSQWIRGRQAEEVEDVAGERPHQLDGRSVDTQHFATCIAKVSQRLAERRLRLFLRVLAPQECRDLFAAVGARLEGEEGQEGERLGAKRRLDRRTGRGSQGDTAAQPKGERRHRLVSESRR